MLKPNTNTNEINSQPKSDSQAQIGEIDWYRGVEVWISNAQMQLLCFKHSYKAQTSAGKWTSYINSRLRPGQTYLECALELVIKSLGAYAHPQDMHPLYVRIEGTPEHFTQVYVLSWIQAGQKPTPDPSMLLDVQWYTLMRLSEATKHGLVANKVDPAVLQFLNNPVFSIQIKKPALYGFRS